MSQNFELADYRALIYIRQVEERIAQKYSEQKMRCPVHLSIGQEAVPVGIANIFSEHDHFVSAHRSHAHYLAKNGSLRRMLGELYGKASGCAGGKGGSMHLIDPSVNFTAAVPIVGSSISIGVGVALGLKLRGENNARVAVFFGDGATEEGGFSESLDFAAVKSLSVLFVCENNFYSVYTNLESRQALGRDIRKIGESHGVKCFSGDGVSVEDVKKTALLATEYMSSSGKPALLYFENYRWREHCGPDFDDDLGYRPQGELRRWMKSCPIASLKESLLSRGVPLAAIEREDREIQELVDLEFSFTEDSPFPSEEALFSNIYPAY